MRRFFLFFVWLTAVCLLAACGADSSANATPDTGVTAVALPTAEPTQTPIPAPTEPTPTAAAPPPPTAEPTEAPTAVPTEEPTPEPTAMPPLTPTGEVNSASLALIADGFTSPVGLTTARDGSDRLFVVDQIGQIKIVTVDGEVLPVPFLDIRDRLVTLNEGYDERGLLGLAFHPAFADNGRFYIYYSAPLRADAPVGYDHTSYLAEYTVDANNPDQADLASEQIILQIDEPQANHNAGSIAFGPDGYLYVPLGDGGGANDNDEGHVADWYEANEGGNGQDIAQNLLGSILRLDVDNEGTNGRRYAIPPDNPFTDQPGAEEVWAIGFRNPYRLSFDMGGEHALFVGDAGQDLWEEVSMVEGGGNYGWNVREGAHCFSTSQPNQSPDSCPDTDADGRPLVDPIIEYQNANATGGLGLVVIGGNIYRGSEMPQWDGLYIFGDWSTSFGQGDGTLLAAEPPAAAGGMWMVQEVSIANRPDGRLNEFLLSFGQDSMGELYILTSETAGPSGSTGKVYKLMP